MPRSDSDRPLFTPLRLAAGVAVVAVVGAALLLFGPEDGRTLLSHAPSIVSNAAAAAKSTTKAPAEKPADKAADAGSPAWSKQCLASPDGKSQACFVQQFVVASPQNTVLLKVLFSFLGPEGKPRMIIEAPEGILIQPGLTLTIDTRKPLEVPLQACQTGACRAVVDMDDQALDQFRKGNTLTVRYVTGDHKALDLPVKLDTLATALKQLTP